MNNLTSSERFSKISSSSSKSYSPEETFSIVSLSSSPIKGESPLNKTYVMTPNDHMSAATVTGSYFKTSGAVRENRGKVYKLSVLLNNSLNRTSKLMSRENWKIYYLMAPGLRPKVRRPNIGVNWRCPPWMGNGENFWILRGWKYYFRTHSESIWNEFVEQ